MKKTIIAALLCTALTGQISAQTEVLEANSSIEVIPASLTTSGKAKVLSLENSEDGTCSIKIYDENLNEVLSKSFNLGSYTQKSWAETAKVIPTGAKLSSFKPNVSLHPADEAIDLTSVKTAAGLAEALNRYAELSTGFGDYYIGFTDIEGYICCRYNSAYCYLEEWFGKQYPTNYVRLREGHIYEVTNVGYEALYNADTATWEQTEELSEDSYNIYLSDFDYKDFDEKEYVENIYASQTLFNDNDTWEFVVPVFTPETTYSKPWQYGYDADGIILRRNASIGSKLSGYKVVDENGTDIPGLSFKAFYEAWRMNGKAYITGKNLGDTRYLTVLYTLDDAGNAVEAIKTAGARRMTRVIGNTIDVNTYDESGNVLLTDMTGNTIGQQSTDGGTAVRFSTDNLPIGIYNVALQRNGRTIATEKVLVK